MMDRLIRYFRANPQVFVLLVICVLLGVGAFIAVLVAFATAGSKTLNGEPSGAMTVIRLLWP
jgi:hypothetical protein